MKPDYKNWIPKGMLVSLIAGTVLSLALLLVFGVFGIGVGGKLRIALGVVFGIAFVVCAKCTQWGVHYVGKTAKRYMDAMMACPLGGWAAFFGFANKSREEKRYEI